MATNRQTDQTTKALPCIVALLFSLAVTAEIASCLPASVRRAVLVILWRAEAVAHSYTYWQLHDHGLSLQWALPNECRQYSDPEDAMLLACWFRLLALTLRDLPRRAFFQKLRRLTSPSPRHSRGEGTDEGLVLPPREGPKDAGAIGGGCGQRQRGPPLFFQ